MISFMDKTYLQSVADHNVKMWWAKFRRQFPSICQHPPTVKLNSRLKTTAGRAWVDSKPQIIDLSTELFWEHTEHFVADTIPHELAHLVAFTIFGDPGHGRGWYTVLASMGINTTRCHDMVNSAHAMRKGLK